MSKRRPAAARTVCLVTLTAVLGCAKSPTRVFEAMEEAAREGKAAEFASHFTEESRPFAEALISLFATSAPAEGPAPPALALLSRSTIESEEIVGDDRALLTVRAPSDQGGRQHVLVFLKREGAWKLDVVQTERQNTRSGD